MNSQSDLDLLESKQDEKYEYRLRKLKTKEKRLKLKNRMLKKRENKMKMQLSQKQSEHIVNKLINFINKNIYYQKYLYNQKLTYSGFKQPLINMLMGNENIKNIFTEYRLGGKYGMGCKIIKFNDPIEVYFTQYLQDKTLESEIKLDKLTIEYRQLFQNELNKVINN